MGEGTVVTFYSYKGGVGRTFALANVGALLCQWGYKVLCVDWDLEAPGLSLYFRDWMKQPPTAGLTDLIHDHVAGGEADWREFLTEVEFAGAPNPLQLLVAGKSDPTYVQRMQALNWVDLYASKDLGSFLERLRDEWKESFDFVLIDSRTGVTDIGGICTVQMPDLLVVLFTANAQSLDGTVDVVERAKQARQRMPFDRAKLLALPVATRFDMRVEYEMAQGWLSRFAESLKHLYEEWVDRDTVIADLIAAIRVPYVPYWSFGERLPVVERGTKDPDDIGFSLETLTALVAQKLSNSEVLTRSRDAYVANARDRLFESPSRRKRVRNVPHARNPSFAGREDVLSALHTRLVDNGWRAANEPTVLLGMGGVGKTEVVSEYLCRHDGDYRVVWWLDVRGQNGIDEQLRKLAAELELTDDSGTGNAVTALEEWLRSSGDWLLVFDGADGDEDLFGWFSQGPNARFVVTSRNARRWTGPDVIGIDVWSVEESVSFLSRRLKDAPTVDGDAVLAAELGCLPLALEQAATYVEVTKSDSQKYLEAYKQHGLDLLDRQRPRTGYPWTVRTVWEAPLSDVGATSPVARELANLLAFFAPDDIPTDALLKHGAELSEPLRSGLTETLQFDQAVLLLFEHSLVERRPQALRMHTLLQQVIRERLGAKGRASAEDAVLLLCRAFPETSDDPSVWPVCARLLPHALAATACLQALGQSAAKKGADARRTSRLNMARLLGRTAMYLRSQFRYDDALRLAQAAFDLAEAELGAKHVDVARYLNNVGLVLQEMGELHLARDRYAKAIEIVQQSQARDGPDSGEYSSNLAVVLKELGELDEARKLAERALGISIAALGANHPDTIVRNNNLGTILEDLGEIALAQEQYEKALKLGESQLGPDHPHVATILNNIGSLLRSRNDNRAALQHFERALKINETHFGKEHPLVATCMSNIGTVQRSTGDVAGARRQYERALSIDEARLPATHPQRGVRLNNLGSLLLELGEADQAEGMLREALGIFRQAFGPRHPFAQETEQNLALVPAFRGTSRQVIHAVE